VKRTAAALLLLAAWSALAADDIGGYIRNMAKDAILDGQDSVNAGRKQYARLNELRQILLQRSDPKALAEVESLAAAGNPAAMNLIGWLLDRGRGGLPRDSYKAAMYFRSAAAKGDANAYYNLSLLLHVGRGLKADRTLGAVLLKKAIVLNNRFASVRAGILAEEKKAFSEAVVHYERAIGDIAHDFAIYRFGVLIYRGPAANSRPDPKNGLTHIIRAANHWNPDAQALLVDVYSNGLMIPKDLVQAGKWMEALKSNARHPLRTPSHPVLSDADQSEARKSYVVWRTTHEPSMSPPYAYDTTIL